MGPVDPKGHNDSIRTWQLGLFPVRHLFSLFRLEPASALVSDQLPPRPRTSFRLGLGPAFSRPRPQAGLDLQSASTSVDLGLQTASASSRSGISKRAEAALTSSGRPRRPRPLQVGPVGLAPASSKSASPRHHPSRPCPDIIPVGLALASSKSVSPRHHPSRPRPGTSSKSAPAHHPSRPRPGIIQVGLTPALPLGLQLPSSPRPCTVSAPSSPRHSAAPSASAVNSTMHMKRALHVNSAMQALYSQCSTRDSWLQLNIIFRPTTLPWGPHAWLYHCLYTHREAYRIIKWPPTSDGT